MGARTGDDLRECSEPERSRNVEGRVGRDSHELGGMEQTQQSIVAWQVFHARVQQLKAAQAAVVQAAAQKERRAERKHKNDKTKTAAASSWRSTGQMQPKRTTKTVGQGDR